MSFRTNRKTRTKFLLKNPMQQYDEWVKHTMMCRYFQNLDFEHMYGKTSRRDGCWCHKPGASLQGRKELP